MLDTLLFIYKMVAFIKTCRRKL